MPQARSRFSYSRYLTGARPGKSALEDFLLTRRSGHCEYFATATVLLLREAGVPARYAVGYAAHEWSRVERRWVVRARDAHAWAVAWVDGRWVDVDTTPPVWVKEEAGPDSAWQPVADLWEWGTFLFSRWRWSERQDRLTGSLGWLLIPLTGLLVWRLWARRRVGAKPSAAPAAARGPGYGDDSEFYGVERRLSELGFARPPAEPLARWLHGVVDAAPAGVATAGLPSLLPLRPRRAVGRRAPAAARGVRAMARRPRVSASFAARGSALTAASRRLASERSRQGSAQARLTGRRARVYFDAEPALCVARRRSSDVVMPV